MYLANKVDGLEHTCDTCDFYELGLDEIMPVSAAHNRGIDQVMAAIEAPLNKLKSGGKHQMPSGIKIALVGQPNAGKSSILNRLCGEERSLVSDVAGTTRDIVDTTIIYNKNPYVILDTAGTRRRAKIFDKLEALCAMFSMRTIEDADVILVVIDAVRGLTDQDTRLIVAAVSAYKPILIIVNKWDLVPQKNSLTAKQYEKNIHAKLGDSTFIPLIFVSCLENQRIAKIMEIVERLHTSYQTRITTAQVNEALQIIIKRHTPQVLKNLKRRIKFYYASQVATTPPTFVIMCNFAREVQSSYKRYVTKQLQEMFGFDAIPIKVIFRNKNEKKAESSRPLPKGFEAHP